MSQCSEYCLGNCSEPGTELDETRVSLDVDCDEDDRMKETKPIKIHKLFCASTQGFVVTFFGNSLQFWSTKTDDLTRSEPTHCSEGSLRENIIASCASCNELPLSLSCRVARDSPNVMELLYNVSVSRKLVNLLGVIQSIQ